MGPALGAMGCAQGKRDPAVASDSDKDKLSQASRADAYSSETEEQTQPTAQEMAEEDEKLKKLQNKSRRKGVAAESVDNDKVKNYKKPVHEKDEETAKRLETTLKEDPKMQVLFGHLDAAGLRDVVNAFQPRDIPSGVDIIRQGDAGDCLYIIKEGNVDVFVARPGPTGEVKQGDKGPKVTTLGSGALFGELALLYNTPRAATVTAASPTVMTWRLDALDFKMLLMQSCQEQYAKYEGWLSQVELLKSLNHYELSRLADAMQTERFVAGATIIKQGDKGDRFFILESGSAAAYIQGDKGEMEVKKYGQTGDYFGEIALLTSEPRKATVRATGNGCSVVSLTGEQFTNMMGLLSDLLKEQADKYPAYKDLIK